MGTNDVLSRDSAPAGFDAAAEIRDFLNDEMDGETKTYGLYIQFEHKGSAVEHHANLELDGDLVSAFEGRYEFDEPLTDDEYRQWSNELVLGQLMHELGDGGPGSYLSGYHITS